MKILAIDPGTTESAYVLWDGEAVLAVGIVPNREIICQFTPEVDKLAVEMIASYGMAVGREVFETCVWIGRFLEAWGNESTSVRIPRLEVKNHLCHSANAKDANVRQALIDRFGAPGTRKAPGRLYGVTSHAWAALAVAVCEWDRINAEVGDAVA